MNEQREHVPSGLLHRAIDVPRFDVDFRPHSVDYTPKDWSMRHHIEPQTTDAITIAIDFGSGTVSLKVDGIGKTRFGMLPSS